MLKILHNLDNSNRGGIQEMILRLHTWSVHRHDFWAADGSMAEQMRAAGMVLWSGGPPEGAEYDVVVGHTVGGWSGNNLADWAHARGAKFIECMHSIAAAPTDPAKVDLFVGVSSLAVERNWMMPRRQVIYPPINVSALIDFPGEHNLIGRLSRLAEEKRPEEFALLAREFPNERWILGGDGTERSRISLSDNLFLPGWILELPKFYAALKLFVFPTKDECNCVSVAQAQAAGVAVICQDIPALRESTGGYATFCTSHDDFVQAVHLALALGPDRMQREGAFAWARRMYDYPITVGAWDTACERLVA